VLTVFDCCVALLVRLLLLHVYVVTFVTVPVVALFVVVVYVRLLLR